MIAPHRLSVVLFVFALAGCKSAPAPAEKVAFESVCDARFDPVMKQGLEEKKRVAVEGYLDATKGFMTLCSDTCQLALYPDAAKQGAPLLVNLKVGDDDARMEELPKQFSVADVKVHAEGGKVVRAGAHVRVSGGRLGTKATNDCQLVDVDRVEAL